MSIAEGKDPSRTNSVSMALVCLSLALVLLALSTTAGGAAAITQSQVSGVEGTIQSAFLSVHNADEGGGNVSSMVSELNGAIALAQQAVAENATDPAQATTDLANASSVANGVITEAGPVGQQGASARQLQLDVSAGSAAVIVVAAALIYTFGDRIYRRAWLGLYRSHVVKKTG